MIHNVPALQKAVAVLCIEGEDLADRSNRLKRRSKKTFFEYSLCRKPAENGLETPQLLAMHRCVKV